jgi:hypothetical protein
MAYFTEKQYDLVVDWFIEQMKKTSKEESTVDEPMAQPSTNNIPGLPTGGDPILRQYHNVIDLVQNRFPVTEAPLEQLRLHLRTELEKAANQKAPDFERFKNDAEYFQTKYSCIRLTVDHEPVGILKTVAGATGINIAQWPKKVEILIRPDEKTVDVYQEKSPSVRLTVKPVLSNFSSSY